MSGTRVPYMPHMNKIVNVHRAAFWCGVRLRIPGGERAAMAMAKLVFKGAEGVLLGMGKCGQCPRITLVRLYYLVTTNSHV